MFWMSVLIDQPAGGFDVATEFWEGVTGYRRSEPIGDEGEFLSLEPPAGDAHVALQRLREGGPRVHLDLHVPDPGAAADEAEAIGATVTLRHGPGLVVMASPGAFPFCFIDEAASTPAGPTEWEHGLRSAVDQVCLDIPAAAYDRECDFWARLTGWELRVSRERDEFRRLIRPPDQPLQILLQRLEDDEGDVRAHLDLASSDRDAETSRHVGLGAEVQGVFGGWTVLIDPAGLTYCITDRDPDTRVLDEPASD